MEWPDWRHAHRKLVRARRRCDWIHWYIIHASRGGASAATGSGGAVLSRGGGGVRERGHPVWRAIKSSFDLMGARFAWKMRLRGWDSAARLCSGR